jgi:hypothetical protein
MLTYVLKSMRPRQWSKNAILFLPLLFTLRQYWRPFTPEMWRFFALTLAAFVVYCMLSGVVYIINDLVDVEKDRAHPIKRLRPIASGKLDRRTAVTVVFIILALVVIGSVLLDLLSQIFCVPQRGTCTPGCIPFYTRRNRLSSLASGLFILSKAASDLGRIWHRRGVSFACGRRRGGNSGSDISLALCRHDSWRPLHRL